MSLLKSPQSHRALLQPGITVSEKKKKKKYDLNYLCSNSIKCKNIPTIPQYINLETQHRNAKGHMLVKTFVKSLFHLEVQTGNTNNFHKNIIGTTVAIMEQNLIVKFNILLIFPEDELLLCIHFLFNSST